MKGCYALLVYLPEGNSIRLRKTIYHFNKGYYVYIGSAMNGLEQRIHRHLRKNKKKHWHIDYLIDYGEIKEVFYKESNQKEECIIASQLNTHLQGFKGFGCSDCRCNSHLFHGSKEEIVSLLIKLGLKPFKTKHLKSSTV